MCGTQGSLGVGADVEEIALGIGKVGDRTVRLDAIGSGATRPETDEPIDFGNELIGQAGQIEMDTSRPVPAALDADSAGPFGRCQYLPPVAVLPLDLDQIHRGAPEGGQVVGALGIEGDEIEIQHG